MPALLNRFFRVEQAIGDRLCQSSKEQAETRAAGESSVELFFISGSTPKLAVVEPSTAGE
jgi:hypothetical protein